MSRYGLPKLEHAFPTERNIEEGRRYDVNLVVYIIGWRHDSVGVKGPNGTRKNGHS